MNSYFDDIQNEPNSSTSSSSSNNLSDDESINTINYLILLYLLLFSILINLYFIFYNPVDHRIKVLMDKINFLSQSQCD
jgi:hypothetical protein